MSSCCNSSSSSAQGDAKKTATTNIFLLCASLSKHHLVTGSSLAYFHFVFSFMSVVFSLLLLTFFSPVKNGRGLFSTSSTKSYQPSQRHSSTLSECRKNIEILWTYIFQIMRNTIYYSFRIKSSFDHIYLCLEIQSNLVNSNSKVTWKKFKLSN